MTSTYPTASGARRPRTQLHRRLADMTAALDTIGARIGTAPPLPDEIGDLQKRVGAIEDALRHAPPWTDWEIRLRALEDRRHRGVVWQDLPRWMTRAMILGVSPTQRRFVVSEAAVAGLRAAGYDTIDQLVAETGDAGQTRAETLHARWEAAHQAEPGSVPPPPPVPEIDEFCRICDVLLSTP